MEFEGCEVRQRDECIEVVAEDVMDFAVSRLSVGKILNKFGDPGCLSRKMLHPPHRWGNDEG